MFVSESKFLKIKKGLVNHINIYEVTEDELIALESNQNGSLFLYFASIFLTSAFGAMLAYLTVENLGIGQLAFIIGVMFAGYIGGFLFLYMGLKQNSNQKKVLETIRERINSTKTEDALELKSAEKWLKEVEGK